MSQFADPTIQRIFNRERSKSFRLLSKMLSPTQALSICKKADHATKDSWVSSFGLDANRILHIFCARGWLIIATQNLGTEIDAIATLKTLQSRAAVMEELIL